MDENDFVRIEELFTKLSDEFGSKVDGLSENFDRKLEAQSEAVHRWIRVQGEEFQHKLDLVVEGHLMLSEQLDRFETSLGARIDAVAADLVAHRADTEAHHGIYRVKEAEEKFE